MPGERRGDAKSKKKDDRGRSPAKRRSPEGRRRRSPTHHRMSSTSSERKRSRSRSPAAPRSLTQTEPAPQQHDLMTLSTQMTKMEARLTATQVQANTAQTCAVAAHRRVTINEAYHKKMTMTVGILPLEESAGVRFIHEQITSLGFTPGHFEVWQHAGGIYKIHCPNWKKNQTLKNKWHEKPVTHENQKMFGTWEKSPTEIANHSRLMEISWCLTEHMDEFKLDGVTVEAINYSRKDANLTVTLQRNNDGDPRGATLQLWAVSELTQMVELIYPWISNAAMTPWKDACLQFVNKAKVLLADNEQSAGKGAGKGDRKGMQRGKGKGKGKGKKGKG
jgi:hypothetical protein